MAMPAESPVYEILSVQQQEKHQMLQYIRQNYFDMERLTDRHT